MAHPLKAPQQHPFSLSRPPLTDDELWWLVFVMWGIQLPRVKICEDHVAPFTAFANAFFARDPFALWYGSRGTGKSLMLALLGLTRSAVLESDVTILGGSMAQSMNVHGHIEDFMGRPNAPRHAMARLIDSELELVSGNTIKPLPASQTTVRGPHPQTTLLDEIDEMDKKIYDAAQGQPMEKPNARGMPVLDLMIASSTWQNPTGTFQEVLDMCREKGLPVYTWCYKEQLLPHGWMKPEFIEAKRKTVPAEMFRVEYELGEPDGGQRAFDLTKIEQYFVPYPEPVDQRHAYHDDLYVWEKPNPAHTYAIGADWAKSKDMTVIIVFRTDIHPRRVAYLRILNRRPWPEMIGYYNTQQSAYNAVGAHDATGMGNVISDYVDERTNKVQMIGQKRTQLINEYIVAFENGHYLLPRQTAMYKGHRDTTVDDVYSPARWDAHLNDDVAAASIAHRAAERQAPPAPPAGVARDDRGPAAYNALRPERRDDSGYDRIVGQVVREGATLSSGGVWLPGMPVG